MSKGYVYILSNECMPGIVKIGMTTRSVEQRAEELYQTGVPKPFNIYGYVLSPNCAELEAAMHYRLKEFRVSDFREFFKVEPSSAHSILEEMLQRQIAMFVEEYLEGYSIQFSPFVVEADAVCRLADSLNLHPSEMAEAISISTPDLLLGAVGRWREVRDSKVVDIHEKSGGKE